MRLGLGQRWPEALWALFALGGLVLMVVSPRWQPIPFNLIWISLTGLYAYRLWPPKPTAVLLVVVGALTGAAVILAGEAPEAPEAELAGVPLLSLLFMLMVFHSRRRIDALRRENRGREREREFIRDASHRLRTPITIARGHAELIMAGDPDSQAARDASVVVRELERLQTISERMLALASAEHPDFLMLEPVPLGDLVDAAADRWRVVADRRWIVEPAARGIVLVDRGRLDEALDALIENALKATVRGDTVALCAQEMGGAPVLVVADRGSGIAAEDAERIFARFARVGPGEGGTRGGTGLGLPFVRAIAEAHGGSAVLAPAADGWTRFELRLGRFETAQLPPGGDGVGGRVTSLSPPLPH